MSKVVALSKCQRVLFKSSAGGFQNPRFSEPKGGAERSVLGKFVSWSRELHHNIYIYIHIQVQCHPCFEPLILFGFALRRGTWPELSAQLQGAIYGRRGAALRAHLGFECRAAGFGLESPFSMCIPSVQREIGMVVGVRYFLLGCYNRAVNMKVLVGKGLSTIICPSEGLRF